MYHVTMIHTKSYNSPLLNVCNLLYIVFLQNSRIWQMAWRQPYIHITPPSLGTTGLGRSGLASEFVQL